MRKLEGPWCEWCKKPVEVKEERHPDSQLPKARWVHVNGELTARHSARPTWREVK